MRTGHAGKLGHGKYRPGFLAFLGRWSRSALLLRPPLQAFAEAAKQTAESFQKDEAPFLVKNRLGLPVSVRHSEMFCPIGLQSANSSVELQDGETLSMDYSTTTEADQFSAMTSLSGKDYYIQPSKQRRSAREPPNPASSR